MAKSNCRRAYEPEPLPAEEIPVMKPTIKDKFVCKYCDETFTVELALFKHYEQCSKKPARFTCQKCGRDFRHEINLQKHNSRCVGEFFKKPRILPATKSSKNDDLSEGASGSQVSSLTIP